MSDLESQMTDETVIGAGIPREMTLDEMRLKLSEASGEIRAQKNFIEQLLKAMVCVHG